MCIGFVFFITIAFLLIFESIKQYDVSYKSSYGLEDQFKTLKIYTNTRTALLKIGFSDTGLIVPWIEEEQRKIYENGIKKIPVINTERLSWDYEFYIAPYKGEFLARDRISNHRQRLTQAINIITEYSKLNINDKDLIEANSFEHIAISFFFIFYDYPLSGFSTWQENKKISILAWNGFNKYAHYYPVIKEDNIAVKSLFALRLIDTAAGIIGYKWDDAKLACDDELISTYQKLRTNIMDLTKPLINKLADDGVPNDKLEKMNINELSRHQGKAEEILKEKCKINLNHIG
jgi:hypothetical protein